MSPSEDERRQSDKRGMAIATVRSQRNGRTVFRRGGAREWPDRFGLLDGNLIVLGKFMSLVTAY